jgi:hypothetical protein
MKYSNDAKFGSALPVLMVELTDSCTSGGSASDATSSKMMILIKCMNQKISSNIKCMLDIFWLI